MFGKLMDKTFKKNKGDHKPRVRNLSKAKLNVAYTIEDINTDDKDIIDFLFTLGCYKGENVTVISVLADNFVIALKDARYSIDSDLAKAILI